MNHDDEKTEKSENYSLNTGIFATFNLIPMDNYLGSLQFKDIPKNILENFRIVNLISHDQHIILKYYCILLQIDEPE
jgi:hypothetical protein